MAIWISHRGIRDNCAENSEAAFRLAVNAGFSWLETDLRSSSDGVLVLSHDPSADRIFGVDRLIETLTIAEIRQLRDEFGGSVLLFSEFADRFSEYSWVLDVKEETADRVIASLISENKELIQPRLAGRVKFLFWSSQHQQRFLASFPQADCFAQEKECWRAGVAALTGVSVLSGLQPKKTYSLPPTFLGLGLYKKRIFDQYRSKNSKILAYLPETLEQANRAIKVGCDYVLANTAIFNK